jgi:hypothetical protein
MRRRWLVLCMALLVVPAARAQGDHIEVGIFGDYFRHSQTETNLGGLGLRLGLKVLPHIKLEGEMAYDFTQTFGEDLISGPGGIVVQDSPIHILHGEFGPKVELGHGRIRPFVVAKAGFDKFFINACPVSFSCGTSQIANIHASSVNAAFYPGGGLEGHWGPVGLRFDVGDEMYFNSGTHHNLRMAFGPYIRF